jgi:hypothetical protein
MGVEMQTRTNRMNGRTRDQSEYQYKRSDSQVKAKITEVIAVLDFLLLVAILSRKQVRRKVTSK